jgi:hypothetical protein
VPLAVWSPRRLDAGHGLCLAVFLLADRLAVTLVTISSVRANVHDRPGFAAVNDESDPRMRTLPLALRTTILALVELRDRIEILEHFCERVGQAPQRSRSKLLDPGTE